jgi:prepilin-type processing-associated H-X9-DG protein
MAADNGAYDAMHWNAVYPGFAFRYVPGQGEAGIAMPGSIDGQLRSDFQSGRHFGGVNVCFADGHVKWTKTATLVSEARKAQDDYYSSDPARKAAANNTIWGPMIYM